MIRRENRKSTVKGVHNDPALTMAEGWFFKIRGEEMGERSFHRQKGKGPRISFPGIFGA